MVSPHTKAFDMVTIWEAQTTHKPTRQNRILSILAQKPHAANPAQPSERLSPLTRFSRFPFPPLGPNFAEVGSPRLSRNSWLKFLHRSYSRTGRWGWLISRRIRAFGWGVTIFAALSAVLGADIDSSGVYLLFCATTSLGFISFCWIWFRFAKVSALRHLPEYGSVGEVVRYVVEVRNDGQRRLAAMLFEEWPSDPRPDFETFANTPEPGEERRNIVDRQMLYYRWTWLQERERGFSAMESLNSPRSLARGETARINFELTPQHRGVIELDQLRLLLPDPAGLFQRCLRVAAPRSELIVLPKRYSLGEFSLEGQAHLHLGGEAASNRVGQAGDFLHLRDYHPGDAMRSVDWKSWARTGVPVVREYEDHIFPRYGLVLDTSGSPGVGFEEAVSVAASFVAGVDTRECLLDLMFVGEKSYRITAGRGVARRSDLLEVLARIQPRVHEDFEPLRGLVQKQGSELTAVIVIFPSWSAARESFFQKLRKSGIEVAAFVIGEVETDEDSPTPVLPAGVHLLARSSIARDLARAADQLFR